MSFCSHKTNLDIRIASRPVFIARCEAVDDFSGPVDENVPLSFVMIVRAQDCPLKEERIGKIGRVKASIAAVDVALGISLPFPIDMIVSIGQCPPKAKGVVP